MSESLVPIPYYQRRMSNKHRVLNKLPEFTLLELVSQQDRFRFLMSSEMPIQRSNFQNFPFHSSVP